MQQVRDGMTDVVLTVGPQHTLHELKRFFEDYKTLENKQVVVEDFMGPGDAVKIIEDALEMYRQLRRGELSRVKYGK